MENHLYYMNILEKVLEGCDYVGRARVAACIVHKGEIISIASNSFKTHPFQKKYGKNPHCVYWHGETRAIFEASKILSEKEMSKCTLYVCRLRYTSSMSSKSSWGIAKPCSGCMRAIVDYGVPFKRRTY